MSAISFMLPQNMRKYISENPCMILSDFNPTAPEEAETMRSKIMFASSGGNSFKCVANTRDFGEDINLCPKGAKEMVQVNSWDVTFSTTPVTTNKDVIALALMSATVSGSELVEITPTFDIQPETFKTVWLVWAYGVDGGFIAIRMDNVTSVNGLNINDEDENKSKFPLELKAFPSIDTPKVVPCAVYIREAAALPAQEVMLEKEVSA